MTSDHYVSQTHLRGWLGEDGLLHAVRKSDLKTFRPKPHSVCTAVDGSTNDYLRDPRVVEKIIKPIEDGYARAVERVGSSQIDPESVIVLAGWIAYVEASSPAAMRVGAASLSPMVEEVARRADAGGRMPVAPPQLGGKTITELLSTGEIEVVVDQKYPQALGVAGIRDRLRSLSNCRWQILLNDHSESPFFTSDHPIVPERAGGPVLMNKVVPLSPTIAVRIIPWMDPRAVREGPVLSGFKYSLRRLKRDEVRAINTLIVRAAENVIIYRDPRDWVLRFVRKHAMFRTASQTDRVGPAIVTRHLIAPVDPDQSA